jgi:hypothetical protein
MRKLIPVLVSVDTLESLLATVSRRWRNLQGPNPADKVSMTVAEAELLRGGLIDLATEAIEQANAIERDIRRVDGTIQKPDSGPRYIEPGRIPSQP